MLSASRFNKKLVLKVRFRLIDSKLFQKWIEFLVDKNLNFSPIFDDIHSTGNCSLKVSFTENNRQKLKFGYLVVGSMLYGPERKR